MSLWQNITIGRYFPGSSFIHGLDPRAKLLACTIIIVTAMTTSAWLSFAVWSLLIVVVVLAARIPPRLFGKNLRAFLWLFAITIALHVFVNPAAPHLHMWGVSVSWPGFLVGCKYALRLAIVIVFASLLSYTTIPSDLADGIEQSLRPWQRIGLPVHEIALMTSLALRFVPMIVDEAQRIQRAQISRGARFEGGLLKRIQALVPMLVPLFVAVFNRADELAVAMQARCYHGCEGRVAYRELVFSGHDRLAILIAGATSAGAIALTLW